MKLRPGRKNPRTLYLQLGDIPSNDDPCLGFFIETSLAEILSEGFTSPWHLNELKLIAANRED